jgi:hypothetical protein
MPIKRGTDSKGPFFRYGLSGKKYYYTPGDKESRDKARNKAGKQAQAIKASQSRK